MSTSVAQKNNLVPVYSIKATEMTAGYLGLTVVLPS